MSMIQILDIIDCALENKIILFKLPAHASHAMQPLDVGVFKTVKQKWKKLIDDFMKKNKYQSFNNKEFSMVLKELVDKDGFKRENAISGFEASGLYPYNPDKVIESDVVKTGTVFSTSNETPYVTPQPILRAPQTPVTPQVPRNRIAFENITNENNTPTTTRSFKRGEHEVLLDSFKNTFNNIMNSSCHAIQDAMVGHLAKYHNTKNNKDEENFRLHRDALYNLSTPEAREQVAKKLEEKKKLADEMIQKKKDREEKKIKDAEELEIKKKERDAKKAEIQKKKEEIKKKKEEKERNKELGIKKPRTTKRKQPEPDSMPDSMPDSIPSFQAQSGLDFRLCCDCGKEFKKDTIDAFNWWACEGRGCDNWNCGCENCENSNFYCKYCKQINNHI